MPGKKVEKLLRKLSRRKYRWKYQMFVAEGPKVVEELLNEGMKPVYLLHSKSINLTHEEAIELSDDKLASLSTLSTVNGVIGIFDFPRVNQKELSDFIVIADRITDPGNLGTIIRTCDWFAVDQIYCTPGTTDIYNAKCVQSAMGSTARVRVDYLTESDITDRLNDHQCLVADMEGENLYTCKTEGKIALVLGSESHGPAEFWRERCRSITIPRHSSSRTESLNVAQAAAIMLAQLRPPSG